MKHTKGEWLMNVTDKFIENTEGLAITDNKNRLIASVSHDLSVLMMEEYEANAKLIAAAPENFESNVFMTNKVNECIKVLQEFILPDSPTTADEAINNLIGLLDNKEIVERLEKAEAAIKKATE